VLLCACAILGSSIIFYLSLDLAEQNASLITNYLKLKPGDKVIVIVIGYYLLYL